MFLKCDQKRDQAKSKALEIYSENFVVGFLLEQLRWLLLILMVDFAPKTKRNVNVRESLHYPRRVYGRMGGRTLTIQPNFLASIGFHFLPGMGLRFASFERADALLYESFM